MRGLLLLASAAWIALAAPAVAFAADPTAVPGAVTAVGAPDGFAIAAAAVAVLAGAGIVVAIVVVVRRRAEARVAPAVAEEWWTCPACGSLNAGAMPRCYACQAARPAGDDPGASVLSREP